MPPMGQLLLFCLWRISIHVPQAIIFPLSDCKKSSTCCIILNLSVLNLLYSTPSPNRNMLTSSPFLRARLASLKAFQFVSAFLVEIITASFILVYYFDLLITLQKPMNEFISTDKRGCSRH